MLHPDFKDMLSEFIDSTVDFMLVGAYALAAYGYPRATGDIDIWVRADKPTGPLVYACLKRFGAPLHDLTIYLRREWFSRSGFRQFGLTS